MIFRAGIFLQKLSHNCCNAFRMAGMAVVYFYKLVALVMCRLRCVGNLTNRVEVV